GATAATPPPGAADGLTGFGATSAEWNAHHRADTTKAPGAAYLPYISGPSGLGGDQYQRVRVTAGRVISYGITLPQGTSQAAAEQFLAVQLPSDAKLTNAFNGPAVGGGSCLLLNYQSPTLGRVLGAAPIGDPRGTVGAELSTLAVGGSATSLDRGNVNSGIIDLVAISPGDSC
ncbi:MAG TPA: hypothetical protein VGL49_01930, partial [Acidimicrobiales bacterium]